MFCTASLFLLQYRYDNKYNPGGIRGSQGVLDLSTQGPKEPLTLLTYGWELYSQEILSPGEFNAYKPAYIYLGQFGGFESNTFADSPHGCATYRLIILLPKEAKEYALELPEIYSSSCIWVNGSVVNSLGAVADKQAEPVIRTGMITFQASERAEIVVQAADYSHYYSGMVYPPAFGTVEAVSDLISFRFLRTCIMVISSFTIGILYLVIGLKTGDEKKRMLLFALTCLLFSLYVSYPLFHLFEAGYWSYRLEDISFFLFLFAGTALHCSLCGVSGRDRVIVLCVSGIAVIFALAIPSLFLGHSLKAMMAYSTILDSYKLLLFSWMIVTAFFNKNPGKIMNGPLLAGLCVIAVSLLTQTLAPVFEPIRFGWQTENAGFVFILLLAGGLWYDTINAYAGRAALAEPNMRAWESDFPVSGVL